MSSPTESPPPADEGEMLQFDQAEFATPGAERPACAVCKVPIAEEYYEMGGAVFCPMCRHGAEASFRGGSRLGRFARAALVGTLAAAVGAVAYYAFVRATGRNWALISILLGIGVGTAVRWGTGNRGGRLYQLLAVFLTYSSIVAMDLGRLLEAMPPRIAAQRAAGVGDGKARPGAEARKGALGPDAPDGNEVPPLREILGGLLGALIALVGISYAIPVLEAMHSPIAGLIYGFALWEAWKINRPIHLAFNGPFRLGAAGGVPFGPEGFDNAS